jgi:hypothetical protein
MQQQCRDNEEVHVMCGGKGPPGIALALDNQTRSGGVAL